MTTRAILMPVITVIFDGGAFGQNPAAWRDVRQDTREIRRDRREVAGDIRQVRRDNAELRQDSVN